MKRGLIIVFYGVIFVATMFYLASLHFGLYWDYSATLWLVSIYSSLYLLTVVGAFFSASFKAIKEGPVVVSTPLTAMMQGWYRKSFLMGLLFSPIVFGIVVGQLNLQTNLMPSMLLAFQNGFFWENLFGKLEDRIK